MLTVAYLACPKMKFETLGTMYVHNYGAHFYNRGKIMQNNS